MAIDDKEKRASVIGVGRPWMRTKFPVATPDEEWRASSGNSYGGNALSPTLTSNMHLIGANLSMAPNFFLITMNGTLSQQSCKIRRRLWMKEDRQEMRNRKKGKRSKRGEKRD